MIFIDLDITEPFHVDDLLESKLIKLKLSEFILLLHDRKYELEMARRRKLIGQSGNFKRSS